MRKLALIAFQIATAMTPFLERIASPRYAICVRLILRDSFLTIFFALACKLVGYGLHWLSDPNDPISQQAVHFIHLGTKIVGLTIIAVSFLYHFAITLFGHDHDDNNDDDDPGTPKGILVRFKGRVLYIPAGQIIGTVSYALMKLNSTISDVEFTMGFGLLYFAVLGAMHLFTQKRVLIAWTDEDVVRA
jgi:hypothetical protein